MSGISAFVFGPLYLYFVHGFLQRRNTIRTPAIVYAVVMLYSMVVHIVVELWGDLPPPNLLVFAGVYAIYVIAPVLLLWRMRDARPFGEP
jgi:Mn2+/Fe2+ NRAMP family transporter